MRRLRAVALVCGLGLASPVHADFTVCLPGALPGYNCPNGCNCYGRAYVCGCDGKCKESLCYQVCGSPLVSNFSECAGNSSRGRGGKSSCSGTVVGDPVDLNGLSGIVDRLDLSVDTPAGKLEVWRTLSTNRLNWYSNSSPLRGVSKLFGESVGDDAPFWSMNWTALAQRDPYSVTVWSLDGSRRAWSWSAANCQANQSKVSQLAPAGGQQYPDELYCLSDREFVLLKADGTQELYSTAFAAAGPFFLTQVRAATGSTLANVNYGPPRDFNGSPLFGCVTGGLDGGVVGAGLGATPFISSLSGPSTWIDFRYTSRNTGTSRVCPLSGLWLGPNASALTRVVVYSYQLDGVTSVAPLSTVTRLAGTTPVATENYSNILSPYVWDGGSVVFTGYESDPGTQTALRENYRFTLPSGSFFVKEQRAWSESMTITPDGGLYDVAFGPYETGDFSATRVSRHEMHLLASDMVTQGVRRSTKTVSCDNPQSCAGGREVWTQETAGGESVLSIAPALGGVRVSSTRRGPAQVDAGVATAWLPSSSHIGVDAGTSLAGLYTPGNCKGLECEWYGWARSGTNQVKNTTTTRLSVLVPGATVGTTRTYYANGELKLEIQAGYSKGVAGANPVAPTETTALRYVGTFYLAARTASANCVGGSDSLGRTVEVHGPCDVSGPAATDCASATYPLTQYVYNDATVPAAADRLRLSQVRRFPLGCGSAPLVQTYSAYDDFGRPQTFDAENLVRTNYTYDRDGHVTSRSVITASGPVSWGFRYRLGRLRAIGFPEGNVLRYCYGAVSLLSATYDCDELAVNQSDSPTAVVRAASESGPTAWSEGVVFGYEADTKNLSSARYYSVTQGVSTLRRSETFSHDADNRLTAVREGLSSAATRERFFEGSVRAAVGHAFNAPPAFCWDSATNAVSTKCTQFEYDGARRLARVVTPVSGGTPVESRLLSNSNGEVCDTVTGTSPLSCDPAAARSNGASNSYEYDDFGNVLAAWTANAVSGTAKGGTRYRYDALGNVTLRQSSQQASDGKSTTATFDQLGRRLSVVSTGGTALALYSWTYDVPGVPCGLLQQWTAGHVASAVGPMGTTFYSYDEFGRVTGERLLRPAPVVCADKDSVLLTAFTRTKNGSLDSIRYPHGLLVQYSYGGAVESRDRVTSVAVSTDTLGVMRTIVSGVAWEPFGGLRYYQLPGKGTPLTVERVLGDTSFVPAQADACPTMAVAAANSQQTGRPSALFVSANGFGVGLGDGNFYKERYAWTADQLTRRTSCLFNQTTTAQVTMFGYDAALRLTSADFPSLLSSGGPHGRESFSYDTRGNLLADAVDAYGNTLNATYQGGLGPDRLTELKANRAGTLITRSYAYDFDGRVKTMSWPADSSGQPSQQYSFGYVVGGGVSDSAVKQVAVSRGTSSLTYEYVYDADNRRRAKVWPTGARDEYFWLNGWQMLEDRGLRSVAGTTTDEYVWLDGQPLAVRRSAFDATFTRAPETTADCTRAGEANTVGCGWRFLVNDVSGRTVLAVDDGQRIAGVYEYQPYGHLNRQTWWGETPHPYGPSTTWPLVLASQATRNLNVATRLRFGVLDVEPGIDSVGVFDSTSALRWSASQYHSPTLVTPWIGTADGKLNAYVQASACNGPPNAANCAGWPYTGAAVESYEYKRWTTGATPWELRLRLPGQYYDSETDLFENWNRYYDPSTGRYLSPEPLLQSPHYVAGMARRGLNVPTYAYALNNPLRYSDPTGRDAVFGYGDWSDLLPFAPAIPFAPELLAAGLVGGLAAAIIDYGPGGEPGAGVPFPIAPPLPVSVPHPRSEPGCVSIPTSVAMTNTHLDVCVRNATGSPDDWQRYCQSLFDLVQRAACRSKGFSSPQERKNWCHGIFG